MLVGSSSKPSSDLLPEKAGQRDVQEQVTVQLHMITRKREGATREGGRRKAGGEGSSGKEEGGKRMQEEDEEAGGGREGGRRTVGGDSRSLFVLLSQQQQRSLQLGRQPLLLLKLCLGNALLLRLPLFPLVWLPCLVAMNTLLTSVSSVMVLLATAYICLFLRSHTSSSRKVSRWRRAAQQMRQQMRQLRKFH